MITPDPTSVSMFLMTMLFYLICEATILVLWRLVKKKQDNIIEDGLRASLSMLAEKEAGGGHP